MNNFTRINRTIGLFFLTASLCSSCVQVIRNDNLTKAPVEVAEAKIDRDRDRAINVFVTEPKFRGYEQTMVYEAIGSNVSSFDQVLNHIKNRARRDGCEALVQVKFYRQLHGSGKLGTSFPKVEAIGIRYVE